MTTLITAAAIFPPWSEVDTWIMVTGALAAVAAALPGCFLLLRKMSMMGDAISHAVLPGLAAGFLLTGSRTSPALFIGAALIGVLTAVFSQWISRFGNVDRGAAMGVVFTGFFAAGLLMIVQAADHVDLDPGCVLYGAIEFVSLEMVDVFGWRVPRAAVVLGGVAAANAVVIVLLFKELRLAAFDAGLADTLGFQSRLLHYLLMTMVAVTAVAAFEAVGSIIIIAMLIVPPATAFLLTKRLVPMLMVAALAGVAMAVAGHAVAMVLPHWFGLPATTSSGMMAAMGGVIFGLAWLFRRDGGLVALWARGEAGRTGEDRVSGRPPGPA